MPTKKRRLSRESAVSFSDSVSSFLQLDKLFNDNLSNIELESQNKIRMDNLLLTKIETPNRSDYISNEFEEYEDLILKDDFFEDEVETDEEIEIEEEFDDSNYSPKMDEVIDTNSKVMISEFCLILTKWTLQYKICKKAVTQLLRILHVCFPSAKIPKSYKFILDYVTKPICHLMLKKYFRCCNEITCERICPKCKKINKRAIFFLRKVFLHIILTLCSFLQ